jgi:phosphopantothenoylcysteine synthetase/decarboxylase
MNVVVTGGGTIAPIDDVRYLANVSSGRFSAMISEAFLRRGASVWHIHTPSAQLPLLREMRLDPDAPDPSAELERLARLRADWHAARGRLHLVGLPQGTVAEYAQALERTLREQPIDVALLAMAVSDFAPVPIAGKLDSQADSLTIHAPRTQKVIRAVRDWAPAVFLVGFKLLSRASLAELDREAEAACRTNRADLTVANDLQTLRQGRHAVRLVRPGHPAEPLEPGPDLADRLVERVVRLASTRFDHPSRPTGVTP